MEYSGLIQKYKVNRPLTDEDKQLHLSQKQRLDVAPLQLLAVSRINSTYLETVDKYYGWKGYLTAWLLATLILLVVALMVMAFGTVSQYLHPPESFDSQGALLFLAVISILFLPMLAVNVWLLRKESFAYTHYPIRLNRKNRTMYVFRIDGTVLTIPWDEVYFTLGRSRDQIMYPQWDVRAHVLGGDGLTVKETFALGMVWPVRDDLKRFWEFHRRYMDEGPQAITDQIKYCLPITDRKEFYLLGLRRLLLNLGNHFVVQAIMAPFFLFFSLGRVFAMKTSKIPRWPQEVEDACRIEAGDPFEKDARHNPPDSWLWKLERIEK